MATLYLLAKVNELCTKFQRHKLMCIDLQRTVSCFRDEVAKELKKFPHEIELIFLGKQLKLDETLVCSGVQSGMTIFALPKHIDTSGQFTPVTTPSSPVEIQQLVVALRSALLNPSFRNMLQLLKKPEVMENIVAATPGLADDPIAQAILQDPELLMLLMNPTHIQRVVELHPSLAEAANPVAAAFHEELAASNSSMLSGNLASSSSPPSISYSLDALSDDDEMDTQEQELAAAAALAAVGLDNLTSPSAITPSQLASALASVASNGSSPRAQRLTTESPSRVPPSPGQLQTPPSTPRSFITPEMFSHAVQQALGAVSQPNLQMQLQQLRDMGITDDSLSMRALEMTSGDVHAALELIFGGFTGSNSENV